MVNGRSYRMCTETRDKRLAQKINAKPVTKAAEGKWFDTDPASEYTFDELMDRFMNEHAPKRKPAMVTRYRCALKYLKRHFSGKTLAELTPDAISSYMHLRHQEGAANATINREYAMLSKAFNLAVKSWGWMKVNPCQNVSKYPENTKRDRWLTWEEDDALLSASEPYLRGALKEIILLALNTGMRQGEILDLRWEEVDFKNRCIIIRQNKTKLPRVIPLTNTTFKMQISRHKKTSDKPSQYVFRTSNNTRIGARNMLRAFYSALRKAKIENFRFHDLRHTFATGLVQAGDQLLRVSQLLGHSQVTTTQRYAHHYLESLRPSVTLLDNLRISRLTNPDDTKKVSLHVVGKQTGENLKEK